MTLESGTKQVLVETSSGETYLVRLPDNEFIVSKSDTEVLTSFLQI